MLSSDATTNVPAPSLTDAGFVAPSEQDILSGVLADMNAALGGGANTALSTPQGQIALSETAILADHLDAQGLIDGLVQVEQGAQQIEQGVEGIIAAVHKKKDEASTTATASSTSVGGIG